MENEIIIYQTKDGQTKIDVRMENETVWLTQAQMAELFGKDVRTINEHIKNIFEEGELIEDATIRNFRIVQNEGNRQVSRDIAHYNLDVIISVGYRVKSQRGTQFRIWATQTLKEYLIKGFTMNDDLLKKAGGGSYWKELLERIRDIRSSEKVFYRQILDLYSTSMDYNPKTPESLEFFKIVQNKIHYAAHGHTAPEVIAERANADLPYMGMTVFEGEQPKKSEVGIAKNYLKEDELRTLNRLVSAFFDLAELRAENRQPMYMKDWVIELDKFIELYGKGVLKNAGKVSHKQAIAKAEQEYDKYRKRTADELSAVERDYIDNLKSAQKLIENKTPKR